MQANYLIKKKWSKTNNIASKQKQHYKDEKEQQNNHTRKNNQPSQRDISTVDIKAYLKDQS